MIVVHTCEERRRVVVGNVITHAEWRLAGAGAVAKVAAVVVISLSVRLLDTCPLAVQSLSG
jgi:hypothetical protein